MVFRENTEGLYSGVEFYPVSSDLMRFPTSKHHRMERFSILPEDDVAISLSIFTKKACSRIVRRAFEFGKEHGRKRVTVIEKPNVIRETSGLMIREARKVAEDYPDISLEANVDAMCMWLLKNPTNYQILVTSNMFGDIISDLCAQLMVVWDSPQWQYW